MRLKVEKAWGALMKTLHYSTDKCPIRQKDGKFRCCFELELRGHNDEHCEFLGTFKFKGGDTFVTCRWGR